MGYRQKRPPQPSFTLLVPTMYQAGKEGLRTVMICP